MDDASKHASDPQLWPKHVDPAIEIGDPDGRSRASYGFSPGDVSQDAAALPLVAPWYPDDKPDSAYWSAGTMAVLRYADLLAEPDPAGAALPFLREGRPLLAGQES